MVSNILIAKDSFMYNNKPLNIIAINSNYIPLRIDIKEQMIIFMIGYVSVILAIIIITVFNGILSLRIYKNVIEGLKLLSY